MENKFANMMPFFFLVQNMMTLINAENIILWAKNNYAIFMINYDFMQKYFPQKNMWK